MKRDRSQTEARTVLQRIGLLLAAIIGWKVVIQPPPARCVIIGAPHTSGWDLPLTLLLMISGNLRLRWIGKDTLFRGPLGIVLRWLGGIPVNRRSRTNFVDQMVSAFREHKTLMIAILPEGTRSTTKYWKTGFYYIALQAQVPIVLGYADYRQKTVGLGPVLRPTGDIAADFEIIRSFYQGITGKYPTQQGSIQIRPPDEL